MQDLTVSFEHADRAALRALLEDREFVVERLAVQLSPSCLRVRRSRASD